MKDLNKRRSILLAAVKVFAKHGFEKTTVDEIAEKTKVAKGTVYYYFESKEEIFNAIIIEGLHDFEKMINESVALGKNAVDKINILIDTEVVYISKYKAFFTVFMGELIKKSRRCLEIEKIIDEGKAEGVFRKDLNTIFVSSCLFWMVATTVIEDQSKFQKELLLKGILV